VIPFLRSIRFNRLFWKIFLAFWVTSLAVIILTAMMIGELAERDNSRRFNQFRATEQAQSIIDHLEESQSFRERAPVTAVPIELLKRLPDPPSFDSSSDGKERKRDRDRDEHSREGKGPSVIPLLIYRNDNGDLLFGRESRREFANGVEFTLTGKSGAEYRVITPADRVNGALVRLQRFLFSFQATLILIGSVLVSLLLTWIVVRPVNRLKDYVHQLHKGEHSVQVEPRLLKRGDEIGELAREFNIMARYVERTLHGQQRLFEDVSHELRAPLARLQAATGLAEQKLGDDNKIAARMNLECERLSRLIDEMLSLARLDHLEASEGDYSVLDTVDQEVEDMSFTQPARTVTQHGREEVRLPGAGNRELFARALSNVFGNILKHTPENTQVDVVYSMIGQDRLRIVITDHGTGVDEAALTSLFEPFYRQNQQAKGYGLGLSIAKRALERLGGRIRAFNAKEAGLSVEFELPLRPRAKGRS
jgi:two-component system OmpR family sensor kinase